MSSNKRGSAWAKVRMMKRKSNSSSSRNAFGLNRNRKRGDGREEYIIKIPGFSGELRKFMTEKEAVEWLEASNKDAFMSAANASKAGIHGVERFNQYGYADAGTGNIMARAAARAFSDIKKEKPKK